MIELNQEQILEFYRRSYKTVDGLWFMKVEEEYGFDKALDIDNEVWKVLPKIQARMLKSFANMTEGMEALYQCFITKLQLEGFVFEYSKIDDDSDFTITIKKCPWHDAMKKSNREHLSGKVGTCICDTEYSVWTSEFGDSLRITFGERICTGSDVCQLRFTSVA